MARAKTKASGDRHLGTAKTIRFTDEQLANLEKAVAKAGGTLAETIDAAVSAYLGKNQPTNDEILAILKDALKQRMTR